MPSSPYSFLCDGTLSPDDFTRFSQRFSQILLGYIPTAQDVEFVIYTPHNNSKQHIAPVIMRVIETLLQSNQSYCLVKDSFYLLYKLDHCFVLAIVRDIDDIVLERSEKNWLAEVWHKVLHSWENERQIYVDPSTNLLNQNSLKYALQESAIKCQGLLLVDLPQKSNNSFTFLTEIASHAQILARHPFGQSQIYYFGASIFAIIFSFKGELVSYGERFLSFLRKEGIMKAHIGMCSCNLQMPLKSALIALDEACRRGPYSFCDYSTLCKGYNHPLAPIPTHIEKSLLKVCKKYKNFSIILFEEAEVEEGKEKQLRNEIMLSGDFFSDGSKSYLLIANISATKAREIAMKTIEEMASKKVKLSAGISYYPHANFTKKMVLSQAQKALCHTKFYGPLTATIFDSTSLNVSGDIYYSEGHYVKACKEYRMGCQIDDKNINILNSLGVTLALMGKAEALKCFDKVLELDCDNFMALYNEGLHYLSSKKRPLAIKAFNKAKVSIQGNDHELRKDIESRLGILYALEGQPQESLKILLPYAEQHESEKTRLAYFIGKSFFEMKKYKQASSWLQKASAFMVSSPDIYSLLGYIYYKTNQGESSLSLSRKAVAMDNTKPLYKLRLAEVLFSYNKMNEALTLCRKLIRIKSTKDEARTLLAKIYKKQGETSKYLRLTNLPENV